MRRSFLLPVVAALVAACSSAPPQKPAAPAPSQPSSEQLVQAGHIASCAAALQTLVQGSETARVEVMGGARARYEDARTGPAALCYGMMLAAPEHPLRDARRAQHVLQEAMAHAELLSAAERALGEVELRRMTAELGLVAQIERLVAELRQERERTRAAEANTALNKRLQTEMEESARLRKQLDEAKAKLDAITRLERSISDRPPAPEGRNP